MLRLFAFVGLMVLGACASNGGTTDKSSRPHSDAPPPFANKDKNAQDDRRKTRPPGIHNAGLVLEKARTLRNKEGCLIAAPSFRAAAALGAGFEIAQSELGACLLKMQGKSEQETTLFQQEGLMWLERAAHAGDASAQRLLAMSYATSSNAYANPEKALSWALVFAKNGRADLFAMQPLPKTLIAGLKSDLPASAQAIAEEFSDNFKVIKMDRYIAPIQEKQRSPKRGLSERNGGGRPRQ